MIGFGRVLHAKQQAEGQEHTEAHDATRKIGPRLESLEPAPFDEVVAEPAKPAAELVVAKVRSGAHKHFAGALGFLGWVISPLMAGRMERVVGAMLILLGIGVLRRLWRERIHFHLHTHAQHVNGLAPQAPITHFHAHSHADELQPHQLSAHGHSHQLPWRSVVVGMVHGLAGSAALALIASQSMPSPAWMLVYIAVFGLGSILGMALLSGVLAIALGLTARHLTGVYRILNGGVALFSLALGGRLLFALGG